MIANELRAGDQFIENGTVRYTLVREIPTQYEDDIAFTITPVQAEGVSVKVWHRNTEAPLSRPS